LLKASAAAFNSLPLVILPLFKKLSLTLRGFFWVMFRMVSQIVFIGIIA
jgi:hypothetical protein